jgi:hypothetical protein
LLFSSPAQTTKSSYFFLSIVFFLGFVPRILVGIIAPEAGGDGQTYLLVAENLFRHNCVSLSDPELGLCKPHWGGNQLPGYPAFISWVYLLLPSGILTLVLAQSLLAALANTYCVRVVQFCGGSRFQIWLVAGLLSLSPITLPWTRFALTESLTTSLAIVIFSELVRSLHMGRLLFIRLSILLTIAVFVRYDAVLLAFPVALAGVFIHGSKRAFYRGLLMIVIISLPLGAWWLRSIRNGLSLLPSTTISDAGLPIAKGYTAWWKTWISHQYQYRTSVFVVSVGSYQLMDIPDAAFRSVSEKAKVEELISDLASYKGQPLPKYIDDQFAAIADSRRHSEPVYQWLGLPLIRAAIMWTNPMISSGWPVSLMSGDTGLNANDGIKELILANSTQVMVKVSVALYRNLLLVVCFVLLVWSMRSRAGPVTFLLAVGFSYAVFRTIVFAEIGLLENRYLISAVPLLEIAVSCGLAMWFDARRQRKASRIPALA